jgi:hypothetical protein
MRFVITEITEWYSVNAEDLAMMLKLIGCPRWTIYFYGETTKTKYRLRRPFIMPETQETREIAQIKAFARKLKLGTEPEGFDEDMLLARLQIDVTMWASMYSVLSGAVLALTGGALLAMLAYTLAPPQPSISFLAIVGMILVLVLGVLLEIYITIAHGRKRVDWGRELDRISKLVKAEK